MSEQCEQERQVAVEQVLSYFCKHVVALAYVYRGTHDKPRPPQAMLMSGFVLSVRGRWFLVTAGHCLAEIREHVRAGVVYDNFNLQDCFNLDAKWKGPIPFDYGAAPKIVWEDLDEPGGVGVDYGVIELRKNYRDLLSANGIVPLDERGWSLPLPSEPDNYCLIGFPSRQVRTSGTEAEGLRAEAGIALLGLEPLSSRPPGFSGTEDHLYFRVEFGPDMDSSYLKGTSGGPIFACYRDSDNRVHYRVVGVQSRKQKSEPIICACMVQVLAESILRRLCEGANDLLLDLRVEEVDESTGGAKTALGGVARAFTVRRPGESRSLSVRGADPGLKVGEVAHYWVRLCKPDGTAVKARNTLGASMGFGTDPWPVEFRLPDEHLRVPGVYVVEIWRDGSEDVQPTGFRLVE